MSSIFRSAPRGRVVRKNTFGSVVTMCRCFERGRYARKNETVSTCSHHDPAKTAGADGPAKTGAINDASGGTGAPAAKSLPPTAAASNRNSVTISSPMRPRMM